MRLHPTPSIYLAAARMNHALHTLYMRDVIDMLHS